MGVDVEGNDVVQVDGMKAAVEIVSTDEQGNWHRKERYQMREPNWERKQDRQQFERWAERNDVDLIPAAVRICAYLEKISESKADHVARASVIAAAQTEALGRSMDQARRATRSQQLYRDLFVVSVLFNILAVGMILVLCLAASEPRSNPSARAGQSAGETSRTHSPALFIGARR